MLYPFLTELRSTENMVLWVPFSLSVPIRLCVAIKEMHQVYGTQFPYQNIFPPIYDCRSETKRLSMWENYAHIFFFLHHLSTSTPHPLKTYHCIFHIIATIGDHGNNCICTSWVRVHVIIIVHGGPYQWALRGLKPVELVIGPIREGQKWKTHRLFTYNVRSQGKKRQKLESLDERKYILNPPDFRRGSNIGLYSKCFASKKNLL